MTSLQRLITLFRRTRVLHNQFFTTFTGTSDIVYFPSLPPYSTSTCGELVIRLSPTARAGICLFGLHTFGNLTQAQIAGSSTASYISMLENRFGSWEATLKDVSNAGYASSEESLNTDNVKIFAAEGRVWYQEFDGTVRKIKAMGEIPGKSMHLRKSTRAHYARANALETARVEALTRAIYSGSIKVTGPYACVNHIGTYPSDGAPELEATTPVPIKIQHGQVVEAIIGYHEVIVAKKVPKKIHVCHIQPEYSPDDSPKRLSSHRIYFAGVLPVADNPYEAARKHYMEKLEQVHLGTSREVKTEQVAVTVLGLTNGLITMFYSDFLDGLHLEYLPDEFHTVTTLTPPYSEPVNLHVVWEADLDGRHIKIISKEQVTVTWRYGTKIWLSDADFAMDRCLSYVTIQKAARQFKNLTLESYAKMVGASTLDIIAAYQRIGNSNERSVGGDACYLFQGDAKLTKDYIRASPIRREQLEGVVILGTPHGDYALRTGAKVMYSRGEGGIWHIDPEGDHSSVPPLDRVGAGTHHLD